MLDFEENSENGAMSQLLTQNFPKYPDINTSPILQTDTPEMDVIFFDNSPLFYDFLRIILVINRR